MRELERTVSPRPPGRSLSGALGRVVNLTGRAIFALAALALGSGCATAPEEVAWRPGDAVVEPDPRAGPGESGPRGYLVVETELTGIQMGGIVQRYRFFLYDEKGRYLDDYPNDRLSSVSLLPGQYVIVSRHHFANHRVQVSIRPGLLTTVTARDLEASPEVR